MRIISDDPAPVNLKKKDKEFLDLLSGLSNLKLKDEYIGYKEEYTFLCKKHKIKFTSTPEKIKRNGNNSCPECAKIKKKETLRAYFTHDINKVKEIFYKRFKDDFKILSKSREKNSLLKIKCSKCKNIDYLKYEEFSPNVPLKFKHKDNCEIKDKIYNYQRIKQQRHIIKYLHNKGFSSTQISKFLGVENTLVTYTLKKLGLYVDQGYSLSKNVTARLEQNGLKKSTYKEYVKTARKLTEYMYLRYKNILDKKRKLRTGKGKNKLELDHIFSINSAFKRKIPLDLKILCHPANLQLLTNEENNKKKMDCWITIKELKEKIKQFEKDNGKVYFPECYRYKYNKKEEFFKVKEKYITVMGMDPGPKNFGVFIGKIYGLSKIHKIKVLYSGMIKNTFENMDPELILPQVLSFNNEITTLLDKYKPKIFVIERFVSRGFKGTIIELVNFMIGNVLNTIIDRDKNAYIKLIMAATWKNKVNKVLNLKELYVKYEKEIESHQLDAMFQAIYPYPDFKKQDNCYSYFTPKVLKKIIKECTKIKSDSR